MKYTLKHLEALAIIARVGSFTRAAEEAHATRPALSLTILLQA